MVRSRVRDQRVVTGKTEQLHDLLSPHLKRAVQAWVDGLKANKIAWDQVQQKMVDTGLPDHKERRESGRAIIEYVVGKAIERSMEVTGSYKELSVLVDELRRSPEAMRLLPKEVFDTLLSASNSEQFTTEGKESSPLQPDSEQKTG